MRKHEKDKIGNLKISSSVECFTFVIEDVNFCFKQNNYIYLESSKGDIFSL